jgi:hypothetical protein
VSEGQVTFGGLTIGRGTDYKFKKLNLHDAPAVRTSKQDRARRHGQRRGDSFLSGRSITASIQIRSGHPSPAVWTALSAAMVVGQPESEWVGQIPGIADSREVLIYAAVEKFLLPIDRPYMVAGLGNAEVEWWATDPHIYDADLTTLATSMASIGGTGRTYPRSYPLSYAGPVTGGLVTATNEGEVATTWQAVIAGPVDNPRVENVTTGQTVGFVGSLAAGQTLEIDSDSRDVLLDGTASRYSWLTGASRWFDIEPGDNEIRLAGTSGTGSMTFNFRSAWI